MPQLTKAQWCSVAVTFGGLIGAALDNLGVDLPKLVWQVALFVGVAGGVFSTIAAFQARGDDRSSVSPKEMADRLHNLVPIREALAYWHFREWNRHLSGVDRLVHYGSAASRFEAYAGNGILEIWGRSGDNPNTFAKPIPADAWDELLIDRSMGFQELTGTEYRNVEPTYKYRRFDDLAVNWKEVEVLFPPKPFRRARLWINKLKRASTAS